MPELAYVGFGSNLGNGTAILNSVRESLHRFGIRVLRSSSLLHSEPWGGAEGGLFTNAVLEVELWKSPREIVTALLSIENELGRRRTRAGEARTCDLDLLLWAGQVIQEPDVIVPHPRLALRRFVLVSLNELIPEKRHPLLGLSFSKLLSECADPLRVWPFDIQPMTTSE